MTITGKFAEITPEMCGKCASTSVRYRAIEGEVVCAWEKRADGANLRLRVEIPPGAKATIAVPCSDPARVREGGRPVRRAPGILRVRPAGGRTLVVVGSGRYLFEAPLV